MTARDPRFLLAAILIVGYYMLLVIIALSRSPINNPDIFKDGMIVLGPPVGAVFGALFRTDAADEKRADNTGKAFDALAAASTGTTAGPTTVIDPGGTATVVAKPDGV